MKGPKGFPKIGHYTAMKKRGMLPKQYVINSSDTQKESTEKLPWWVWVVLLFAFSSLLRLCGFD